MRTVLIIEDNLEIRENTAEILELAGFNVLSAEDGNTGMQIATNELPDVILCDIMMPVVNGYEVFQHLKQFTGTAQIPFIYFTASTEHSEIKKAKDMGADDFVCKPFDAGELVAILQLHLK